VYNNRSRFLEFNLAPSDNLLVIGTSVVRVEGHGITSIVIECKKTNLTLDGKRTFILYNIVYILLFIINIVSYN
jgi:hypothetical protein